MSCDPKRIHNFQILYEIQPTDLTQEPLGSTLEPKHKQQRVSVRENVIDYHTKRTKPRVYTYLLLDALETSQSLPSLTDFSTRRPLGRKNPANCCPLRMTTETTKKEMRPNAENWREISNSTGRKVPRISPKTSVPVPGDFSGIPQTSENLGHLGRGRARYVTR